MKSKEDIKVVFIEEVYKKRRKEKSSKTILKTGVLLIVLVVLIFKTYNYLISLPRTQNVIWGTLENSLVKEGIVLREEVLVASPRRGYFYPEVESGTRVREGQTIGYIKSVVEMEEIKYPVKVKNSGIVSFELDGLENILQPSNLENLDLKKIKDLDRKEKIASPSKDVYKGEPLFKITNNFSPVVFVTFLNEKDYELLKNYKDKKITVEISEHFFKGTILNLNNNFLILEISNWDKQFLNKRNYELKLILESATGYIVPQSSVVKKEDVTGVYLYNGKNYTWNPIKILGKKGENFVIDGLKYEAPIVKNPEVLVKK